VSRARVAVLVSGSGSNLQALIDAARTPDHPAELAVVVSNVSGAFALERARQAGLPTEVVSHRDFSERAVYDAELVRRLRAHAVEWVCLAGFMRLLGPTFLQAFPMRVLNVHPALLPAFPGMHAPRQALEAGVKLTGCTVHFVDEGADTGPIIAQAAVEVLDTDDVEALATRIQAQEHRLYPQALALAVSGRLRLEGRRVLSA